MCRSAILILLFTVIGASCFSQKINVDSIKNELAKGRADTSDVINNRILAGTLRTSDPYAAITYARKGAELGQKLGFDKGTAGCFLNLSACYSSLGKLDSALLYIDTAIFFSHLAADPSRLALAYLNRADYFMQLQDFEQSLKNCDTSLQYAEKANSDDRRARVFQTFGSIYFYQKLYDQSTEYYKRADALYRKINNLQMSAIVLNNLATVYKNTGDLDQAARNMREAIDIADSLNDLSNLGMYHGTLSDVYFQMANYGMAEKHAHTSMQYAVELNNETQIANAWEYLGQVFLKQSKFASAIDALQRGYNIFRQQENLDKIHSTADILADAYAQGGNYEKAYEFTNISRAANDSLVKQRFDEDIAALQTRFRVDEKDKAILLLNKEKELSQQKLSRQRLLVAGSIVLLLLLLIGIGLLISRYRLRNRMKELQLRNQIAADLHDEVGSSLSSIHMLSQIAYQKGGDGTSPQEILQKMSTNAKETMERMGDIVWMIKPGENEGASLVQRMQRFIFEMCQDRDIQTQVDIADLESANLSMHQRKNLYLIFKEALNNAVKYSGARQVIVAVKLSDNKIVLRVKDDGKGFDLAKLKRGNGLDNMKNRATDMKGELDINSEPGKGTSIRLLMPV